MAKDTLLVQEELNEKFDVLDEAIKAYEIALKKMRNEKDDMILRVEYLEKVVRKLERQQDILVREKFLFQVEVKQSWWEKLIRGKKERMSF